MDMLTDQNIMVSVIRAVTLHRIVFLYNVILYYLIHIEHIHDSDLPYYGLCRLIYLTPTVQLHFRWSIFIITKLQVLLSAGLLDRLYYLKMLGFIQIQIKVNLKILILIILNCEHFSLVRFTSSLGH